MFWIIYKLKLKFNDGSTDTTTWPCAIVGDVNAVKCARQTVSGEPLLEKVQSFYKNFPSINAIEKQKVLTVVSIDILSSYEVEKL